MPLHSNLNTVLKESQLEFTLFNKCPTSICQANVYGTKIGQTCMPHMCKVCKQV